MAGWGKPKGGWAQFEAPEGFPCPRGQRAATSWGLPLVWGATARTAPTPPAVGTPSGTAPDPQPHSGVFHQSSARAKQLQFPHFFRRYWSLNPAPRRPRHPWDSCKRTGRTKHGRTDPLHAGLLASPEATARFSLPSLGPAAAGNGAGPGRARPPASPGPGLPAPAAPLSPAALPRRRRHLAGGCAGGSGAKMEAAPGEPRG